MIFSNTKNAKHAIRFKKSTEITEKDNLGTSRKKQSGIRNPRTNIETKLSQKDERRRTRCKQQINPDKDRNEVGTANNTAQS